MGLDIYHVPHDFFEVDDGDGGGLAFPCCVCVHRHGSDREAPCRGCCHNANADAVNVGRNDR